MAGIINYGKGTAPATPSSGNVSVWANNTGQMMATADTGVLSAMTPVDRPNLIRNSGLWFAQRQLPTTLATYSSTAGRAFGPDGWAFTNENASVQYVVTDTQNAPESGLQGRFYGNVTKITANGKIVLSQCIENTDISAVRGRTVRLQFWMKATASITVRLGLIQLSSAGTFDTIPATYISAFGGAGTDPTLGANLAYIAPKSGVTPDNCTVNGNACDVNLTTAWQRFGACFDVPSNCKNIIVSVWSNAQITTTNGWSWSQASLTDGYEIQDWTPLPTQHERIRCQRFLCKNIGNDSVLPATNYGIGNGASFSIAGKAGAAAEFIPIIFETRMRISPTMTLFNPSAANAQARDVTGAADCTGTTTTNITSCGGYISATGAAGTAVGNILAIGYLADAEL